MKVALAVVVASRSRWAATGRAPRPRSRRSRWVSVGRIATDNLGCHLPLVGNQCLIVTCANCTGAIPDAPSEQQNGVRSARSPSTKQQIAALGFDSCTVNRVKVAVELLHPFVGDLLISLTHDAVSASLYQPNVSCSESDGADGFDGIFGELGPATKNSCPFETGGGIRPDEPLAELRRHRPRRRLDARASGTPSPVTPARWRRWRSPSTRAVS